MKVPALSAVQEDKRKNYNSVSSLPASASWVSGGKSFSCFLPVDHVEPVVDICGAQVIMFEIIGVFPHIDVQEECAGLAYGRILIGGGYDFEDSIVGYKPCIAGTEDRQSGSFEL